MITLIQNILQQHQLVGPFTIQQIIGLGVVNQVFEVRGQQGQYIIRLNEATSELEYQKEYWCLERVASLGIPTAKVLARGLFAGHCYMIQAKIPGQNGKQSGAAQQALIWQALGRYARKFHQVKRIEVAAVEEAEFHHDWFARLRYNLEELNPADSLLARRIFTPQEYQRIRQALERLLNKKFQSGLVHGDLCPRNVIVEKDQVALIDWGTAEINVVPHNEIGVLLMSGEASPEAFAYFLEGMGISDSAFQEMKPDILLLNLLHQLDKYRWAESYDAEHLSDYGQKIRVAFEGLEPSST
ncbi:MAG: aminoglycoside phosphotransferase family protein [Bacteroidota bacterium]